jgi:hypothetical protein
MSKENVNFNKWWRRAEYFVVLTISVITFSSFGIIVSNSISPVVFFSTRPVFGCNLFLIPS